MSHEIICCKPVEEYASYLRITLNRSPLTIEQYKIDLELFFKYTLLSRAGGDPQTDDLSSIDTSPVNREFLGSITSYEIYRFLTYAADVRGNQAKARARKLSALKGFFKYFSIQMPVVEDNPTAGIAGPPIKPALPKFLSEEESVQLLETVQNDTESKTRERDYAIITLFLNCGMRLSELVGINLSDIDRDLRSLRVLGKGSKERIVYLNEACRMAISDYLRVRALDEQIKDRNALFLSSRHTRISNKTVQWIVYKYLSAAGLEYKHLSTHKLRHTAATLMYRTGKVDVRVLKDILGHEQLNTTQIYTHVSDRQMEAAMDNNPLSHIKRKKDIEREKDEDSSS